MHPYVRHPACHGDHLVFVTDDDLWLSSVRGGATRRLTAVQGVVSHPRWSPNGAMIAYLSTRDGAADVYVCAATGGPSTRLTWLGSVTAVSGFTPHGAAVVFASSAGRPTAREVVLWSVSVDGGAPARLPWGAGVSLAYGPNDAVAIGRNSDDLARWKRYRGGRRGVIWSALDGADFAERDNDGAGAVDPMWLGDRLWFVSDAAGTANLFSEAADGSDRRQETHHTTFCVRHARTDGAQITYACGADAWHLIPGEPPARIALDHQTPAEQRALKHVPTARFLESATLHPDGRALALVVRGKVVRMSAWEGAPLQLGARHDGRYRLARFLADGERIVATSDASGEERLVVFDADGERTVETGTDARPIAVLPAPEGAWVAVADDRGGLRLTDVDTGDTHLVETNARGRCGHLAWSPDGRWLVWRSPTSEFTAHLRIANIDDAVPHNLTDGRFDDLSPSFDPTGRYLAFLSKREFDAVYDSGRFDLGFPLGVGVYVATLRPDLPSPLRPTARGVGDTAEKVEREGDLTVVVEGLGDRVVRVPLPAARFLSVHATADGLLVESEPVTGVNASAWRSGGPPPAKHRLHVHTWDTGATTSVWPRHSGVALSANGKATLLRVGDRLRVVPTPSGDKKAPAGNTASRANGWIDLARVSVAVDPTREWGQMFDETWRWMRDHFWREDMSGTDWPAMRERYRPLVDRLSSRTEYADLIWELVGELGTSHSYEMMGDYRPTPSWRVGHLAADVTWSDAPAGWRLTHIARGEPGTKRTSPLVGAGVGLVEGDVLTAIDGLPASADRPIGAHLVDRGGRAVSLTVQGSDADPRDVVVTPLRSDSAAWLRDWVRRNRERVHAETGGRVGYVHIPDMGPGGFADFHRDFLRESARDALIVDVRYNGGGHVSELILEKLRRRAIGHNVSRWEGVQPYPSQSVPGPMVAITNELAGSDGDIFSHCFKLYGLGPLIGHRTWGGVVGIWPRARHADGSLTTQPEYSFWFKDVGYGVENYGTDPDIAVENTPEDWAAGRDPQLTRALAEVTTRLDADPPVLPDLR